MINSSSRLRQFNSLFSNPIYQAVCDLRVASIGIIESYNPTKQTAVVQLAINELVVKAGVVSSEAIKLLGDVPVVFPGGGGLTLTLPVALGDECLVVFNDNCYNGWYVRGGQQDQERQRRHDLSDGIALVGLRNQTRVLQNVSTTSAQLRTDDGQTVIDVKQGQITVTAPTVNIQATNVDIAASQTVTITGNSSIMLAGRNFLEHVHVGVQSGGGVSGIVE